MGVARWFGFFTILTIAAYGQMAGSPLSGPTVHVPALVELKSGEIAYGLSADDFLIKDEGVEQQVALDIDRDVRPRSVLLVVQIGHNATPALKELSRLWVLLDVLATNPQDQVGILTFDSTPHTVQELTADPDAISSAIASIKPGNSGAAVYDAMHLAINSLQRAPQGNPKIIILISSDHDHGSVGSDSASLIRDVASSNALIYGLSFREGKGELLGKLRTLNPLAITTTAMERNVGATLAEMTGGEFSRFNTERQFDDRFTTFANHFHNLYSLSFRPNSPSLGLHSLQVGMRNSSANVVSAREAYWVGAKGSSPGGGGSE